MARADERRHQGEADKHPEIKVIYKDAQNDTLQQRAQVEEFVGAKIDLLIISPKEAQPLTEPVSKAMAAGIPVIVLDRDVIGRELHRVHRRRQQEDRPRGREVDRQDLRRQEGKVVELMGLQTSTPGQDRHNGFLEGIKGSDLNVIFGADMKWLEPNARKEMESALARFDKIDLVYGHNDPGAHGAYLAAKAAGREKGMKFVGIDSLPQEGVAYVKQGILTATFQYPTGGDIAITAGAEDLWRRKGRQEDRARAHGCSPRTTSTREEKPSNRARSIFLSPGPVSHPQGCARPGGLFVPGRAILGGNACSTRGPPWTTRS